MTTPGSEAQGGDARARYAAAAATMRHNFEANGDGEEACRARAAAVDTLIRELWARETGDETGGASGAEFKGDSGNDSGQGGEPASGGKPGRGSQLCVLALGGFGRGQLFPASDIDLLFCGESGSVMERSKGTVRAISQALWDCGLTVAPMSRSLGELERFKASDPEGSLALLDVRFVAGDPALFAQVETKLVTKRSEREARALVRAAATLSGERHKRFGHTAFHLEPNIKDGPGGLRDVHVCDWLRRLGDGPSQGSREPQFEEAVAFLTASRVFLHLWHGRDDNTLDWHAQQEAAERAIGFSGREGAAHPPADAAYWMRAYFRHARAVGRTLARALEHWGERPQLSRASLRYKVPPNSGLFAKGGVLHLKSPGGSLNPAQDPEIVLGAFGVLAESGLGLAREAEERIGAAIPSLSASLEDGPRLWARLRAILVAPHAAAALREMHALGVLEFILPEFHGIDALVIRDAYHRYTVDEHTFVLLEVLHRLEEEEEPGPGAPEWRLRFRSTLRELPYPELLFLAALLHDTGKGRTAANHAAASAALAEGVCARLELGPYETGLVVRLIECHLEMSAALRRDIFDPETVRAFADRVGSHGLLRMLTLFTYADISAVHPDALTPWKAENLWRLLMATANQLDRSVDEDRIHAEGNYSGKAADGVLRVLAKSVPDRASLLRFLEGFPERYLRTRTPEVIRQHLGATEQGNSPVFLEMQSGVGEVTVVAVDRPQLFADLTGELAGWGLEVVTAEAFSNSAGTVVDSFRFIDRYRTLELNPEERDRFLLEVTRLIGPKGEAKPAKETRRTRRLPPRRVVTASVEFDETASAHSTLLQIVAQDVPGLLRTAALVLSGSGCSVEVALIDTEGEMAIDVFYLTRGGQKLSAAESASLRRELLAAIAANER